MTDPSPPLPKYRDMSPAEQAAFRQRHGLRDPTVADNTTGTPPAKTGELKMFAAMSDAEKADFKRKTGLK